MGAFSSKEWAEVYNDGSPGSPEEEGSAGAARNGRNGKRVLPFDPRSISDDVERTPIQLDKTPDDAFTTRDRCVNDTPTGVKSKINRLKRAVDPRSPSGLPRTPILVEDKKSSTEDCCQPLKFDKKNDVTEISAPKRGAASLHSAGAFAANVETTTRNKETFGSKKETNSSGKSLPGPSGTNLENDCRSPLLIVDDDGGNQRRGKTSVGKFVFEDSPGARQPLAALDGNASTVGETAEMLEKIHINNSQKPTLLADESLDGSLII